MGEDTETRNVARARAAVIDERGLILQPHGGALRPFTAGTGAAAARSSVRAARKVSLDLLRDASPQATQKLIGLLDSPDDRVAAVAAAQILDRALGKPGDAPQMGDGHADRATLPVKYLTSDERSELYGYITNVQRLTSLAHEREAAAKEA